MKKYIVVITYNFDSHKPTWVCNTLDEAWQKLLEVLEHERQIVINESGYEPSVEISKNSYEATFHYDENDKANYFIIEIEL